MLHLLRRPLAELFVCFSRELHHRKCHLAAVKGMAAWLSFSQIPAYGHYFLIADTDFETPQAKFRMSRQLQIAAYIVTWSSFLVATTSCILRCYCCAFVKRKWRADDGMALVVGVSLKYSLIPQPSLTDTGCRYSFSGRWDSGNGTCRWAVQGKYGWSRPQITTLISFQPWVKHLQLLRPKRQSSDCPHNAVLIYRKLTNSCSGCSLPTYTSPFFNSSSERLSSRSICNSRSSPTSAFGSVWLLV